MGYEDSMKCPEDYSGKDIGSMHVLKKDGEYKGESYWLCQCQCGNSFRLLHTNIGQERKSRCPDCRGTNRRTDITGQQFGRLVAKEYLFDDHRKQACWLFQCECGNEKILTYQAVKWNGVQSCGCLRSERVRNLNRKDITGRRFGRLIALTPTDQRDESGSVMWHCRCDCGAEGLYSLANLSKGAVQSCGCFYRESRKTGVENRHDLIENTSLSQLVSAKQQRRDNTSGVTGVYYNKHSDCWIAYINYKKKRYYLGAYKNKNDAIKARQLAEQELHDPMIEEHWDEVSQERQNDYLSYLNGFSEYPPSVNI